jgi:hypothetical protein
VFSLFRGHALLEKPREISLRLGVQAQALQNLFAVQRQIFTDFFSFFIGTIPPTPESVKFAVVAADVFYFLLRRPSR